MPSCADGPAHLSAWPVPGPTAVEQEALRLAAFRGRALVAALQPLVDNFAPILSQLHRALKGGDLLTMTYYFPLQNQCPKLVPVIQQFNDRLTQIALENGTRVAPVFEAFGGPSVPNPLLCTHTWISNSYHDFHPTTRGDEVIASAFAQTAAYSAAGED